MKPSDAMIDSSLLSANDYNEIPDMDENSSKLFDRVRPEILSSIAVIFAKNKISRNFGIHLLHRHFSIPDHTVMVYNSDDPDVEICRITAVDDLAGLKLRGRNFRVNKDGRFQAYEYDIGVDFDFPNEFLMELAAYIIKHDLQNYIALEYDPTPEDERHCVEFILKPKALIKVRKAQKDKSIRPFTEPSSSTVGWSFWPLEKSTEALNTQCREAEDGRKLGPNGWEHISNINSMIASGRTDHCHKYDISGFNDHKFNYSTLSIKEVLRREGPENLAVY